MVQKQLGRFLTNIEDPRLPEVRNNFLPCLHVIRDGPKAMKNAWQEHLAWVGRNVIGPPKACKAGTSEELIAQGMIGLYAPVEEGGGVGDATD
jgi:hypothetical protein